MTADRRFDRDQRADQEHPAFGHVVTERLELRAFSVAHLDEVYALMSDPRVWRHRPSGVHTRPATTAAQLDREAQAWELDGLGYWTAWLRHTGAFVGVGGCRLHGGVAWNLYYRIRPELQGNGYATELARAALIAARARDQTVPIIAYVLAHNTASRRVASAVGLHLAWEGMERDEPTATARAARQLFCDRQFDAALLTALRLR